MKIVAGIYNACCTFGVKSIQKTKQLILGNENNTRHADALRPNYYKTTVLISRRENLTGSFMERIIPACTLPRP